MAQNVEAKVKAKIEVDTKDAQKQVNDLAKEIEKLDIGDSLDKLGKGYSAIDNAAKKASDSTKDFASSSNELEKILDGLLKSKSVKGLGGLGVIFGIPAAGVKLGIAEIKAVKKELDDMLNIFDKVAKAGGEGALAGISWFIDSLGELSNILSDTLDKLQELSEAGIEIQNTYISLGNFLGDEALGGLSEYADALEQLKGLDATGVIQDMSVLAKAVDGLAGTSDELETASKVLYEYALNLHGAYPSIVSTSEAVKELSDAINNNRIAKNGALGSLLSSEEIKEFKSLNDEVARYNYLLERAGTIKGAYDAYLQTESGRIEVLSQQYQSFLGNIGQIALSLYATIAPVLTKILALANGVLSALMSVFNINVKSSTGVKGGGFSGVAENIEKVGSAAKKATKQVASFDDVIQINDSKSGGGGAGGFDTEGLKDFSSILDDVLGKTDDLTDKWKKFKELLANKDFAGAGSEFARVIGDELWNINWNDIQTKAKDASSAISSFINGLVDINDSGVRDAWEGTGYTVAQVLNTIIGVVSQFLYQTHFGEIGKALGLAWQAMWASLNVEEAGQALYNGIMGVFDFVGGFLESGGLKQIALAAKKFIQSFFGSFDNIDIAIMTKTATDLVDDIINSIGIVAEALTSDDVKRVVFGLITKLVEAFKDKGPEWGKKLNVIVIDILNFISEAISTADKAGLVDAINQFMDALDLGTILSHFLTIAFQVLLHKAIIELNKFKAVGDAIGNIMYSAFLGVIGKILGLFTDLADKIRNIFSNLFNNPVFTTVLGVVTGSASASSGGLLNNIKNKFKVPRLATGGITTGSTIANIGEAGQEAILPLEGNTAWMDKLATKIAGQMGTTGAGGTVKVSLSDKPFYTKAEMYEFAELIVKSLKVYGLNVAIV